MKCDHLCTECGEHEQRYFAAAIAAPLIERQLCLRCEGSFYAMLAADFDRHGRPRTDEEYCAHLARFSIRFNGGGPSIDEQLWDRAAGLAEGGLGPAYAGADDDAKTALIEMCARALRSELDRQPVRWRDAMA
jgi:hypothetical protein